MVTHLQGQHGIGQGGQGRLHPPSPPIPTPGGGSDLFFFLTSGTHTSPVPSGGITGDGYQQDQPPGSLCTSPHLRYHCGPVGVKPSLALLT